MAIQWMDFPTGSAGLYGSNVANVLNGSYAENSFMTLVEDPDPSVTGFVPAFVTSHSSGRDVLRKVLTTSRTTVGMALRFYCPELPNNASRLFEPMTLRNGSNVILCSIAIRTDGRIEAWRGTYDSGTLLATSAAPAIVAQSWQHIETKFILHDSTGSIEVRVDGVEVLLIENVDTLNAAGPCTQVGVCRLDFGGLAKTYYFRDFIIWDDAGSYNNDFLGSCSVVNLLPSSDVTLGDWVPSTGSTGWDLLDEAPPNDSDYIAADSTSPSAAQFGLTNLPVDVTSVRGLMTIGRMRKTDGGDAQVQMNLISAGDTWNGSDRPITTAFTYWFDISEESPDTLSPWTPVEVDAVTLEIDRTV